MPNSCFCEMYEQQVKVASVASVLSFVRSLARSAAIPICIIVLTCLVHR